jgi:hypothetical protein
MNATPKADIGIVSQLPATPTRRPTPSRAARLPPASPARIASAAATAGRPGPGGREEVRVEHAVQHVAVEQHPQRRPDQHRRDEVRAAEQERHPDRQHEAIGGAEGCGRNRALRQVLDMDRAVAGEDREGHARQQHRDERTDNRGVRGDAELQDQLDTDHCTKQA